MSNRIYDFSGFNHFRAFRPWLARIPKTNRTVDAVIDEMVNFMTVYNAHYGAPMSEAILDAFCSTVHTEIVQRKIWPVSCKNKSKPLSDEDIATILAADYKAMMNDNADWGDIVYDNIEPPRAELDSNNEYIYDDDTPSGVANMNPWAVSEDEALEDFVVPDLTLRKGIWENWPVVLKPIDNGDGTARYSIEWHWANLEKSFETTAHGNLDLLEWQDILRIRLLHALGVYNNKYTVEAARDNHQICVIAMVHGTRVEATATATNTPVPAAMRNGVRRALDILKMAPVTWDRDGNKHMVKLHNKKCKELGLSESTVKTNLMAELATCGDCTVSTSNVKGIICVVNIV